MKDKVLVLVGPSAAGKTTIQEALVESCNFTRVTTCTTRKKRNSEINGIDYFFITEEEFETRKNARAFLEYDKIGNDYYGIAFDEVLRKTNSDTIPILVLSPSGIPQVKNSFPDKKIIIVYLWAKEEVLLDRLKSEKYNGVRVYKRKRIKEEIKWGDTLPYDMEIENLEINKTLSNILALVIDG